MHQDKSLVKAYYDEHTKKKLHDFVYGNARVQAATEALLRWMPANPQRIFEIGCGIGYTAFEVANRLPGVEIHAFDISQKSVDMANQLFAQPGLTYLQADRLQDLLVAPDLQYDAIYMVDVLEHIPPEERPGLFAFVTENLSPKGRIFLACPTPAFLAWCKREEPHTIQPVDEDIEPGFLLEVAAATDTDLLYYELKNIWRKGDYFHAVLGKSAFESDHKNSTSSTAQKPLNFRMLRRVLQMLGIKSNQTRQHLKQREIRKQRVADKLNISW